MTRYVCIHGHFYQPPRENPWTGRIDRQKSALPFHDWNERITIQCYGPNAAARLLDGKGKVRSTLNNYSRISFNFGPTLLSWMEKASPETYTAILASDAESASRFFGHGGAIAQAYSHMIMPLASSRDKRTQVIWGVGDFRHRFGRDPEGMWLPETAVDVETLEIMAEEGILFTVLAPHQARRIREEGAWKNVPAGQLDIKEPYRCLLPSGRSIAIFFYNGTVAHDIAFGSLLRDGGLFARRMVEVASGEGVRLSHVAVDGETFGHHHRFGEMALAYCLETIEKGQDARLTVYGEFLEKFPPVKEVEIAENTSWSCSHGVERWRSDCGCRAGDHPEWKQMWRGPLRESLDGLRAKVDSLFEEEGRKYFDDPWEARDGYIDAILSGRNKPRGAALTLLEMERNAMLMFTSCGWFFDDISRIETLQILRYAARTAELAGEVSGRDFMGPFLEALEKVPGNTEEMPNARVAVEGDLNTLDVRRET
jgi:alpha-amylase/alpha-mannosidase (GH57 family)